MLHKNDNIFNNLTTNMENFENIISSLKRFYPIQF